MGKITLHIVPRAKVTEPAGVYGDAIRVRVAAPPADGAANSELVRFLAERLGVPKGRVRIVSGALGRRKVIEVDGMAAESIRQVLGPKP
jgi:uncharacterized protein (TIGR00251 family)